MQGYTIFTQHSHEGCIYCAHKKNYRIFVDYPYKQMQKK